MYVKFDAPSLSVLTDTVGSDLWWLLWIWMPCLYVYLTEFSQLSDCSLCWWWWWFSHGPGVTIRVHIFYRLVSTQTRGRGRLWKMATSEFRHTAREYILKMALNWCMHFLHSKNADFNYMFTAGCVATRLAWIYVRSLLISQKREEEKNYMCNSARYFRCPKALWQTNSGVLTNSLQFGAVKPL